MDQKQKPTPGVDPKLLEIIRRGAISPVRLQPLTYENAVSLRMRLYRLKRRLTETSHEAAPLCELITIRMFPSPKNPANFELLVCPRSMGFEAAFLNAGITTEEPPPLD